MFFRQIKKCRQSSCTIYQSIRLSDNIFDSLDWLPDPIPSTMDKDHYVNFQTAYQSGTTEQYRPILMTTMANSEHIRYLYSKRVLSAEDKIACQIAIDDWDYSFKSPFVLEDNILYNNIFVREKISCE
ncbi:uncharacterized protein OCT59_016526 [Rhizophagus irregularis]|uniref:uncharacterized protein n=1 Tax=Rhizophagus irregularis TaxID=588596 RepID=UPI001C1BB50C|nr:hypothetical protein OCT59_016526 [Rhizophagus irregularis]CAB4476335.1 unnamed protein product [Rhizophagus irregularis]